MGVTETAPFWQRVWNSAWWWGSILVAFVASFLPYWIWNFVGGARGWADSWRIPVAPNAVFDSYLYFQQLSLLKAGIHTGTFNWFVWPLRVLMAAFPRASIPEIWVISRWIVTFLLFWLGAWSIKRITGVGIGIARWLIISFWLSFLLVIGLRPGMSSWYLPFAFLGLVLIAAAFEALRESRWVKAVAVSITALLILKIYPWFLLFGGTAVAGIFASQVVLRSRQKWLYVLTAIASLAVCGYAVLLVAGKLTLNVPVSIAQYDRNGINFSHMPLISNTVLAMGLWLVLLLAAKRRLAENKLIFFALAWITLITVWLSTPIIGIDILNDHFIIVTALLSWITLGLFVNPSTAASEETTARIYKQITLAISVFASLFFIYILQKAFRNVGKFEPYTIHLSIWLALSVAAWFQWLRERGEAASVWWRRLHWPLAIASAAFGALGLWAVIVRSQAEMAPLWARLPVISWIRAQVPRGEAICADPASAKILAVHDEHVTYPSDSNLMFFESDADQHRRLITVGAAYDADAAKQADHYPFLINGVRTLSCAQYAEEASLLERLGMSHAEAQKLVGCQEQRGAAIEREVMAGIRAHQVDAQAFKVTCPWVVIPDDQKLYWHLPDGYAEARISADTSAWHLK